MEILEESFVSYQFSEDTGPSICRFVIDEGKRKGLSQTEKMMVLLCVARLAKKLAYVDDLEGYSELLYHCMEEQAIVMEIGANDEWKRMMLEVYSEVIELSMRNRKVRELLTKKVAEQTMLTLDHLFLGYKVALWERSEQKANLYLKRMEAEKLTNY